jgi:hypothetical protein
MKVIWLLLNVVWQHRVSKQEFDQWCFHINRFEFNNKGRFDN